MVSRSVRRRRARRKMRAVPPRKMVMPDKPVKAVDFSTRERSLRSSLAGMRINPRMDPWVHCRLDPFSSAGATAKPDGRGYRFLVVEHFTQNFITAVTGAGFAILTLPGTLPFTALANGLGATAANDFNVDGKVFNNSISIVGDAFPLGVPTAWSSSYGGQAVWTPSSSAINDPYLSQRARVTSVSRKLRYTGTVVNDAGQINVTPCPLSLSVNQVTTNNAGVAPAAGTVGTRYSKLGTAATYTDSGITIKALDVAVNLSNNYARDTVVSRVDQGVRIISKQTGDIHDFVPVPDSTYLVTGNNSLVPNPGTGSQLSHIATDASGNATASPMGVSFWDPSWIGEVITVTGPSPGATFVFETAMCVEYMVGSSSSYAPFTQTRSPLRVAAIEAAQTLTSRLPIAIPGTPANPLASVSDALVRGTVTNPSTALALFNPFLS